MTLLSSIQEHIQSFDFSCPRTCILMLYSLLSTEIRIACHGSTLVYYDRSVRLDRPGSGTREGVKTGLGCPGKAQPSTAIPGRRPGTDCWPRPHGSWCGTEWPRALAVPCWTTVPGPWHSAAQGPGWTTQHQICIKYFDFFNINNV